MFLIHNLVISHKSIGRLNEHIVVHWQLIDFISRNKYYTYVIALQTLVRYLLKIIGFFFWHLRPWGQR